VADLARLNFLLGELYAEAVLAAQKKFRLKARLVGCHGQTLYHQGTPAPFLGRKLSVTWQTGEAARIAARVGAPVVSDFRPADMAVGGKGAPLVPYLDYLLYRDRRMGRIALNIGGIANLTAIPANASPDAIVALDTGPGNMVMDALAGALFGKSCDRGGSVAAKGTVLKDVVRQFLRRSFFLQKPPKTAGREEFGREFVAEFLAACRKARAAARMTESTTSANADALATATAFTAYSIADAVRRYVLPRGKFAEVIASGGGTRNSTLMAMLANALTPYDLELRTSDEFGVPSEAKEAVAFAVLAYETWNRRPSNVPSATGAKKLAVLGKISYP
jgi:anhydro-N-acetylmuramic acid kinase